MNAYKLSPEERAHRSAIETFDYEIAKKLRQIKEWREVANAHYAKGQRVDAAHYQRLIADTDRRIAHLKQRRFEVDEQEKQFRESQVQYTEDDYSDTYFNS